MSLSVRREESSDASKKRRKVIHGEKYVPYITRLMDAHKQKKNDTMNFSSTFLQISNCLHQFSEFVTIHRIFRCKNSYRLGIFIRERLEHYNKTMSCLFVYIQGLWSFIAKVSQSNVRFFEQTAIDFLRLISSNKSTS